MNYLWEIFTFIFRPFRPLRPLRLCGRYSDSFGCGFAALGPLWLIFLRLFFASFVSS